MRFALLLAVLIGAAVPVSLALAQSSSPPTATSAPASNVNNTGATLNGSVNPNGTATNYAFQYGPTTAYGEETTVSSAGNGSSSVAQVAAVTGLRPGTTYHYRIIAFDASTAASSPVLGADETFTTTGTAPAPSAPPVALTGASSGVTGGGATVAGTVDPAGQATTYYFEYGTTTDFGLETVASSAGSGTTAQTETATLSALAANTTYHYRIVAVSPGGVSVGAAGTFTTTNPPAAVSYGPSGVSSDAATFNGTVNPNGHSTTYYFQYGTTTAYGLQTAPASAGGATSTVAVHTQVTGLTPGTVYHYRLVAASNQGTSYGADETAATPGSPTGASTVKLMGHMGFVSPGNVIGVEVGCFSGSAPCNGSFTMTVDGTTIGSGSFSLPANSGEFRNFKLNAQGQSDLRGNRPNHLVNTTVSVTTTSGQKLSGRLSLARWSWRDI
jgi:hypothetical protein